MSARGRLVCIVGMENVVGARALVHCKVGVQCPLIEVPL